MAGVRTAALSGCRPIPMADHRQPQAALIINPITTTAATTRPQAGRWGNQAMGIGVMWVLARWHSPEIAALRLWRGGMVGVQPGRV